MVRPTAPRIGNRNAALSAYENNRSQLIQYHQQLVLRDSTSPISPLIRESEGDAMGEFRQVREVLDSYIQKMARQKLRPGKQLDFDVARLSFVLYLCDRIEKMQALALERNSLSVYMLFTRTRKAVLNMLRANYFKKSNIEIIRSYLPVEPLLVACQNVCGLQPLNMGEAVELYKHVLRKEVVKKIMEGMA